MAWPFFHAAPRDCSCLTAFEAINFLTKTLILISDLVIGSEPEHSQQNCDGNAQPDQTNDDHEQQLDRTDPEHSASPRISPTK
jgi:hypothetical protein